MPVSHVDTFARVNYSETDQMGVVYHARYAVWLDVARTEYLRQAGMSYRELEALGFFLVVGDLSMRYHHPARYDDPVRVRCWVRELASRRVTFAYRLTHAETGALLVTAETKMLSLNHQFEPTRLPSQVASLLRPIPDPE
jgi:acyl-CoA thioester hydrolase